MSLNSFYKLGSLWCQFNDFELGGFWNFWQWKLNPYQRFDFVDISRILNVRKAIGTKTNFRCDHQHLVLTETCGFFDKQVYGSSECGTKWSLVRRKNDDVYIQYAVSSEWNDIVLEVDNTNTNGQVAFEYLGLIIPHILLKHQMLTFHGVLMEHNGCGVIISAPSGTGKTTHARMWRDSRNALIINGDRATCQNINGVWTGFGLPWSGTSGEQINRSVPITAIVVLEQGETNQARQITSPLEAFMMLLPHVQYPSWDKEMTSKAMDLLEDFLKEIPVIRLSCLPDLEAVDVLEKAIEQL